MQNNFIANTEEIKETRDIRTRGKERARQDTAMTISLLWECTGVWCLSDVSIAIQEFFSKVIAKGFFIRFNLMSWPLHSVFCLIPSRVMEFFFKIFSSRTGRLMRLICVYWWSSETNFSIIEEGQLSYSISYMNCTYSDVYVYVLLQLRLAQFWYIVSHLFLPL